MIADKTKGKLMNMKIVFLIVLTLSVCNQSNAFNLIKTLRHVADVSLDVGTLGEHGRQRDRERARQQQLQIEQEERARRLKLQEAINLTQVKINELKEQYQSNLQTQTELNAAYAPLYGLNTLIKDAKVLNDHYNSVLRSIKHNNDEALQFLKQAREKFIMGQELSVKNSDLSKEQILALSQDPFIRYILDTAKFDFERAGQYLKLLVASSVKDQDNPEHHYQLIMQKMHRSIFQSAYQIQETLQRLNREEGSLLIRLKSEEQRLQELSKQ